MIKSKKATIFMSKRNNISNVTSTIFMLKSTGYWI